MDTFADRKMVKDNSANPEAAKVAEAAIWTALDLDEVGDQMKSGLLSSGAVVMGTGAQQMAATCVTEVAPPTDVTGAADLPFLDG